MLDGPPSIDELDELPHRALVALAVRNALRALPFYATPQNRADPAFREDAQSLLACIQFTIDFCQGAKNLPELTAVSDRLRGAGQSAIAAVHAAFASGARAAGAPPHAAQAIMICAAIRTAASAAIQAEDSSDPAIEATAVRAFAADAAAIAGTDEAEAINRNAVFAATIRDYERLKQAANASANPETFTIDPRDTGPLGSLWISGPLQPYAKALGDWERALHEVGISTMS